MPGSLPSPSPSLSNHKFQLKSERDENAIESDQNDDMEDENAEDFGKARTRRASEGQHLIKDGKKSNGGDLKCDKCGKGYKHSSCLSKHLYVPPIQGFTFWLSFHCYLINKLSCKMVVNRQI